jgi:glycerol-3-phosphate dehydrogenase
MIGKKLGTSIRASRTAFTVLPGAGIADHEALAIETGREYGLEFELPLLRHLIARYAEGAAEIVRLIAARPELRQPLAPDVPTIGAEVVHVVRNEMAVRLSDIIVRRTGLGATGYPGDASVHAAARIAAAELQWDDARVRAEIAACRDATRIP